MEMIKKLNLGAGTDLKEGFDNHNSNWFDFNDKKWPIENEVYDYVLLSHVLMYVKNFENFFDEIHRICKDNAIIEIYVPHVSSNLTKSIFHTKDFAIDAFGELEGITKGKKTNKFKIIEQKIVFREKRSSKISYLISKPITWFFNLDYRHQILAGRYVSKYVPFYGVYCKIKILKKNEK